MYRVLSIKYLQKTRLFLFFILAVVYLLLNTASADAQGLSLSIDPSIIEINALPPSTVKSNLTIQNKSDSQIHLLILLKPFKAKLENARPPATSSKQTNTKQEDVAGEVGRGELEYINSQNPFILKNVQILDGGVPIEGITLGPKQQKDLTLTINIPKDSNISARPPATSSKQTNTKQEDVAGEVGPARQSNAQALAGGRDYYFSIIFISQNTSSPTSNASLNQLGIATNVLLSVGAKETPTAVVEEFSSGLFFEKGPVPFTIRLKNQGIHFIKPKGEITIKNMFGQNIGKLDLMSVNILSDSTRAIPNVLWKEDFLLGFYTATLNIALSDDGPNLSRSIHFLAFPFKSIIVTVIVLISAIIIVNRVRSHMKK